MRDGRDEAKTKIGELSAIRFFCLSPSLNFMSLLSIGHWKEQRASDCLLFVVLFYSCLSTIIPPLLSSLSFCTEVEACVHVCAFCLCQGYSLRSCHEGRFAPPVQTVAALDLESKGSTRRQDARPSLALLSHTLIRTPCPGQRSYPTSHRALYSHSSSLPRLWRAILFKCSIFHSSSLLFSPD